MIEDEIFNMMTDKKKSDYTRATLPHVCSMCGELSNNGYKLSLENMIGIDLKSKPYIFICEECYKELPD